MEPDTSHSAADPDYMEMIGTCAVCGYVGLGDEHDICLVCGWHDDHVQRRYPDSTGANRDVTLRQAQINWKSIGMSAPYKKDLMRARGTNWKFELNPNWRPLTGP